MTPASTVVPPVETVLKLFVERFLNRTDELAVLMPWEKPGPAKPMSGLDTLLRAHVLGSRAPGATIQYKTKKGEVIEAGRYRLGAYAPAVDGTTKWLCIDFDGGAGHASPLADAQGAALQAVQAFEAAGLPAYLERSKSGEGWHLWCFFETPIAASLARAVGYKLVPRDAPLVGGGVADPEKARGIEVFPKQDRIHQGKKGKTGHGNMVWLPFFHGAKGGGNLFYRPDESGELVAFAPTDFRLATSAQLDAVTASAPATAAPPKRAQVADGDDALAHLDAAFAEAETAESPGTIDWDGWKAQLVAAVPLDRVYGEWLTGKENNGGWLECRDPASDSGDRHPSAGVADGSGDAERATFHSFRTGESLDVFDFVQRYQGAADFMEAARRLADFAGMDLPKAQTKPKAEARAAAAPAATPTATTKPKRTRGDERPEIQIVPEEHLVVQQAIDALASDDRIFQRAGKLVQIIEDPEPEGDDKIRRPVGALTIADMSIARVGELLSARAKFMAWSSTSEEWKQVHPPAWVAWRVHGRGFWEGIRPLRGVVSSPVLRPDGTVLTRPGYDAKTALFYVPKGEVAPLPESPSHTDAIAAARELLDVVVDFPFKDEVNRSAWLAALLTPLVRGAFEGNTPLFLVDANTRRSGKSRLCDCINIIVNGATMPRSSYPKEDEEMRKRITTHVLAGDQTILLDNIRHPLGCESLEAVLTSEGTWTDRALGSNSAGARVLVKMLMVIFATGNNVKVVGDTGNRTLRILLHSMEEFPEEREGFKHNPLLPWVREQRPRLLAAALTLLRAWYVAGKPDMKLKPWGSFETWGSIVRNVIVWVGLPDPWETRHEQRDDTDAEGAAFEAFLNAWLELDPKGAGLTAAEAIGLIKDNPADYLGTREAFIEFCAGKDGELPEPRKLGDKLRYHKGRVRGGMCIEKAGSDGHAKVSRWKVTRVMSRRSPPSLTQTEAFTVLKTDPADPADPAARGVNSAGSGPGCGVSIPHDPADDPATKIQPNRDVNGIAGSAGSDGLPHHSYARAHARTHAHAHARKPGPVGDPADPVTPQTERASGSAAEREEMEL